MTDDLKPFDVLTAAARKAGPIRVAVADAAQTVIWRRCATRPCGVGQAIVGW